jgi:hypothetical protein
VTRVTKILKMKNRIYAMAFSMLFVLTGSSSLQAQNGTGKPKVFESLPEEIICNTQSFDALFLLPENSPVQTALANNFTITGTLTAVTQKYNNLRTLIIRLTNYPDVLLSLSRISDTNLPEHYVGRLISSRYSDGFEIHLENNVYKLKKIITDQVIQPCH